MKAQRKKYLSRNNIIENENNYSKIEIKNSFRTFMSEKNNHKDIKNKNTYNGCKIKKKSNSSESHKLLKNNNTNHRIEISKKVIEKQKIFETFFTIKKHNILV